MIKNLKELRAVQPQAVGKPSVQQRQPPARQVNARQESEDMDFDDWSESDNGRNSGFKPTKVQKGFFAARGPPPQQSRPVQYDNGYYDDEFDDSEEIEALPFNGRAQNGVQHQQQQRGAAFARQQQAHDVDFDDSNDFDESVSNGQESDDFGDVQLNVRQFKSSAKKVFVKKDAQPAAFENFTDESGFNFEDDESRKESNPRTNNAAARGNANVNAGKQVANKGDNSKVAKAQLAVEAPAKNLKPAQKRQPEPSSVEQFQDSFSDDFTQNVGSIAHTQVNAHQRPAVAPQRSGVETFKSDFDEYKDSFNVDISNFDNGPAPPAKAALKKQVQAKPAARNYNEVDTLIAQDRDAEARYLSDKLDENDAYARKIREFMEQKAVEHEKLKARYELLLKEKVRTEDEALQLKQEAQAQQVAAEQLSADCDAKQLVIDELTEKLAARQEELKAKTKLLAERENLFGNSLSDKKLHAKLIALSRELELAKVRNDDYEEAVRRYEARTVELEDELRGSPAAIRTKAMLQQRVERLLQLLADNGINVDVGELNVGDLNEDMVYQEMILNGYVRDNKKLIEENKYLKEKLFAHKVEESKAHFDSPAGKLRELEESVRRLQEELGKKDEQLRKHTGRYDQADAILLEREREIEVLRTESEAAAKAFKKEKAALESQRKELFAKTKELKTQLEQKDEEVRKTRAESKRLQSRGEEKAQPKLQRNIFSHSDQDFKQDIFSMLNNINADSKQVRSELRGLKDTWELKGKLGDDARISDVASPKLGNELGTTLHGDVEALRSQVSALRAANGSLEDKLWHAEQLAADKEKDVRKAEFLKQKWQEERQQLLEVIRKMPKSARDIDFAVLEQKLINLEKEQKLKNLEIKTALKTIHCKDLSESTDTVHRHVADEWQAEKSKLRAVVQQKNDQISKLSAQLARMVDAVRAIKADKA